MAFRSSSKKPELPAPTSSNSCLLTEVEVEIESDPGPGKSPLHEATPTAVANTADKNNTPRRTPSGERKPVMAPPQLSWKFRSPNDSRDDPYGRQVAVPPATEAPAVVGARQRISAAAAPVRCRATSFSPVRNWQTAWLYTLLWRCHTHCLTHHETSGVEHFYWSLGRRNVYYRAISARLPCSSYTRRSAAVMKTGGYLGPHRSATATCGVKPAAAI